MAYSDKQLLKWSNHIPLPFMLFISVKHMHTKPYKLTLHRTAHCCQLFDKSLVASPSLPLKSVFTYFFTPYQNDTGERGYVWHSQRKERGKTLKITTDRSRGSQRSLHSAGKRIYSDLQIPLD